MGNPTAKVANTLADKLVEIERLREELAAALGQLEAAEMPVHYYNEGGIVYAVYGSSSINYVNWLREKRGTAYLEGVKAGLEAAAEWADWLGAQYSVATDRGALIKPASSGIRAIDPTTIKESSDG